MVNPSEPRQRLECVRLDQQGHRKKGLPHAGQAGRARSGRMPLCPACQRHRDAAGSPGEEPRWHKAQRQPVQILQKPEV